MHGYKKPKSKWDKKNKKNKFNDYYDDDRNYEKKSKRYYSIRNSQRTNKSNLDDNDYE